MTTTYAPEPVVLRIPRRTPTQNEWDRLNPWQKSRQKDIWRLELVAARGRRAIPQATTRMRVTVTRSYTSTELDASNVAGGAKRLLDILSQPRGSKWYGLGWIVDDSPLWCEERYGQVQSAAHFTEIRLEPIGKAG